MNEDTIRFLIEQKVTFINAAASVCMSWWVTSTLFSGSILATVWAKRNQIIEHKLVNWLGCILFVFFSSIVFYGFMMTYYLSSVQSEIDILVEKLKPEAAFFHIELSAFFWAMIAGTISFVLVWAAWIFLWINLSSDAKKKEKKDKKEAEEKAAQLDKQQTANNEAAVEQFNGREGKTATL
jgi:large-conductance mechanosensitive channel